MNKKLLPQTPEGAVLENALLTTFDLDMNELKELLANEKDPEKYLVFYGGGTLSLSEDLKDLVIDCTFPSGDSYKEITITHSKVWLFEYKNASGSYTYNLIIHSSNISQYNSLEIAVRLEGRPREGEHKENSGLIFLLDALTEHMHEDTPHYEEKKKRLTAIRDRLVNVAFFVTCKWQTPNFKIVTLGILPPFLEMRYNSIFSMCSSYDELVICAPFVFLPLIEPVKKGMKENGRLILITNQETASELEQRGLLGVTILTPPGGRFVHAKFCLRRLGDSFDLYAGSMNGTYSAVGHNIETMIYLRRPAGITSIDSFIDDFFST